MGITSITVIQSHIYTTKKKTKKKRGANIYHEGCTVIKQAEGQNKGKEKSRIKTEKQK